MLLLHPLCQWLYQMWPDEITQALWTNRTLFERRGVCAGYSDNLRAKRVRLWMNSPENSSLSSKISFPSRPLVSSYIFCFLMRRGPHTHTVTMLRWKVLSKYYKYLYCSTFVVCAQQTVQQYNSIIILIGVLSRVVDSMI